MEDVLTRVPLLARVPGMKPGQVSREMVELFDVMPTVLELAGVEAKHTHFARSLMPQLRGEQGDPARAAFCEGGYNRNEPQEFEPLAEFGNPNNIYYPKVKLQNEHPETITRSTMVRTREHKLVARPDGQGEFYDLRKDPRELKNLFGEKSYATQQAGMVRRMLDWYIRTADVAPQERDARGFPPRDKAR